MGGAVLGARPLEFIDGKASFDVIVKKYAGDGDEGLELGVTTTKPEEAAPMPDDYATNVPRSWISCDGGFLMVHGAHRMDDGFWKTIRPSALKRGDVVTFVVHMNGDFEVFCNGVWQIKWDQPRNKIRTERQTNQQGVNKAHQCPPHDDVPRSCW